MATMITSECINCGACEPECPNTAIYQGGVEWQAPDGSMHPALSDEIFYIVPEKCTECVGFHDQEACAAVCPVDCCVPNPDIPESHDVLMARARELHPELTIPDDAPSRFKAGGGEPAAAPAASTAAAPAAAPAPAAAAPAPAPVRAGTGKVEKKGPAPKPRPDRTFAGELPDDFEVILSMLGAPRRRLGSLVSYGPLVVLAALQGLVGACSSRSLRAIETTVSDTRFFRTELAVAGNLMLNVLLYPLVGATIAVLLQQLGLLGVFDQGLRWAVAVGLVIALGEAWWRLRECFRGVPFSEAEVGPALYAPLVLPILWVVRVFSGRRSTESRVGFDGFSAGEEHFDEKLERARRYGDVFRVEERDDAYLVRIEFPRRVPPSSLSDQFGLGEEMPDYDFDLALKPGRLEVHGRVVDPQVRKLTAAAPAFPSEFTTRIELDSPVTGFRHRYQEKTLEVLLPKAVE